MMPRLPAMLALFGATALLALSAETPANAILVLSKGDHTLSIVDPATLRVVARTPSGPDPHEVIASQDGRTAYISNYGGGAYNTLTVVDLVAQKTTGTIDLGGLRGPHGLFAAGGKIWFTAEAAKAFARYDPASHKVDFILGTGQDRTHMLYVLPDLARVITSNISSATMTIADKRPSQPHPARPPGLAGNHTARPQGPHGSPEGQWSENVVAVGRGAEGFDVSPDRKQLWAANAGDGTISVIDLSNKAVVQTINANTRSANRLKFTPDGKIVLVSLLNGSDVVVLDTATRRVIKRIPIGHGSAGILMQPDGSRAFVSCTPDGYVAVVNLKSLAVEGHLDAGKEPDGVAWAVRRQ